MTARPMGRARHAPSDPPPWEPLRGVTSDVWYTLLYLRRSEQHAFERRRRAIWSAPLLAAGWGRAAALRLVLELEVQCHALEARGRGLPVPSQAEWLARRSKVPVPASEVSDRLDRLLLHAPVHPAHGGRAMLHRWQREGLRLAIVSNVVFETARGTRALLEREGLLAAADAVFLSVEHPWAKPDRRAFLATLKTLGVPPAAAVHIGDREWDSTGALDAGMRAIRFRRYPVQTDPKDWLRRRDGVPGVPEARSWTAVGRLVERMRSGKA